MESLLVWSSFLPETTIQPYQKGSMTDTRHFFGEGEMAKLAMDGRDGLAGPYVPTAIYFGDSDCVEYVKEDAFCIYDRVDEFLTLIFDETKLNLIGFKLKGFKHIFETHLKPVFRLNGGHFVALVTVIETVCNQIGQELFESEDRASAYKAARKLAANDNARLFGADLMAA